MIKPLHDYILMRKVDAENSSGIIVLKPKPNRGIVIAVGEGLKDDAGKAIPLDVKVGDTVIFRENGPDEMEIDGKKLLLMRQGYVLAIEN
jgi:chaperonin GroES